MNTVGNLGKTKIWIAVISIIVLGIFMLVLNRPKDIEVVKQESKMEQKTTTPPVKKTTSTVAK